MKTTIIQAFVLTALAALGVCVPTAEIVDRGVATAASPPGVAKGYTGQLFNAPETPAGITVKVCQKLPYFSFILRAEVLGASSRTMQELQSLYFKGEDVSARPASSAPKIIVQSYTNLSSSMDPSLSLPRLEALSLAK
jgi:hypothetical protein